MRTAALASTIALGAGLAHSAETLANYAPDAPKTYAALPHFTSEATPDELDPATRECFDRNTDEELLAEPSVGFEKRSLRNQKVDYTAAGLGKVTVGDSVISCGDKVTKTTYIFTTIEDVRKTKNGKPTQGMYKNSGTRQIRHSNDTTSHSLRFRTQQAYRCQTGPGERSIGTLSRTVVEARTPSGERVASQSIVLTATGKGDGGC